MGKLMDRRGVFQPTHLLNPEQRQRMHEAGLEVLQRTGLRVFEAEALELLRRAGANISDGNRVRIPARLVEEAVRTAPKSVTLYDRFGEPAIVLDGYRSFFGTGSDCAYIIDRVTGQRRHAVLQDVVEAVTLVDALRNIDFCMSMFMPGDVDDLIADRYQMEVMLGNTSKPIVFVNYDYQGCEDNIAMAEAVAGSAGALRERPFVVGYVNVVSSLRFNEDSVQKLLYLAGKGLPCVFSPGATAGLVTPITAAASVMVKHAGSLAGLVLSQLKSPGTPIIIPGSGGAGMDMRTMIIPYCDPQGRGATQGLSHHLGLPMFAMGGTSDSHVPDQQAAAEASLTMLTDAMGGGHLVHDVGYLEQAMCSSLAHIAVCDEIINWIRGFTAPLEVSEETLALDLINQVGPDGGFLETEHTLKHYRERWSPKLLERDNYENWVRKGSKTLEQRAAEHVDKILATHRPKPLTEQIAAQVHAVMDRVAQASAARQI